MALLLAPLLLALAAPTEGVGVVSHDGWWKAWQGSRDNTPSYRSLGGSEFWCLTGTLLEAPDETLEHRTSWEQADVGDRKVAYRSLAGDPTGGEVWRGAVLVSGLYDERLQASVIRVCYPRTVDVVKPDDGTDCIVNEAQIGPSLDATDCPVACLVPAQYVDHSYHYCQVDLANSTCAADARCVPAEARYDPMDSAGRGQLRSPATRGGCLAAEKGDLSVEPCDPKAAAQVWTLRADPEFV